MDVVQARADLNVMVHLWHPSNRVVTGYQIMSWHADAVADGHADATQDLLQAISNLEDLGQIAVEWPLR